MTPTSSHTFIIAGHTVCIDFAPSSENGMQLLPAFEAFRTSSPSVDDVSPLFTLTVDDSLRPATDKKLIRKFDTGNGDTLVYLLPDGGYQYIVRDIMDNDCCLLITDSRFSQCRCALNGDFNMRSFGLNNAVMLAYAFAGAFRHTLLIHASTVVLPHSDYGYVGFPFTAASGTGKSTHTSLWLKHIEHAELLNDDNPVIRIVDGKPFIYGSPWSGKTPCYRNRRACLAAVTQIERAPFNKMERLSPVAAFAVMLPACSSMKWDTSIYQQLCDTITTVIETVPVFTLHCLPDEDAAHTSHKVLTTWKV